MVKSTKLAKRGSMAIVAKKELDLQAKANQVYAEAQKQSAVAKNEMWKLGGLLSALRDGELWKHVTDSKGTLRFQQWTQCADALLGPMARGKQYGLIAAYEITQGKNPIPAKTVRRMGIKKAEQVHRLEPEERTPEIIEAAQTESLPVLRNRIQAKLNEKLPADEQKEPLVLVALNVPKSVADEFEELLDLMTDIRGIRDTDHTQTLRQKAFGLLIIAGREYYAEELADALQYRADMEATGDAPAAQESEAEEGEYMPDADEEAVHADH